MGTPCESTSVAIRLRAVRVRALRTVPERLGPSSQWFHEWLSFVPSRLSSRLASLCLWSYVVRSCSVKPSWAVTKFTDDSGVRPEAAKRPGEPTSTSAMRTASSP